MVVIPQPVWSGTMEEMGTGTLIILILVDVLIIVGLFYLVRKMIRRLFGRKSPAKSKPSESKDWTPMSLYKEKVVGVTKKNDDGSSRQKIIRKMKEGDPVMLVRDPDNPYDSNAIEVWNKKKDQIRFIDQMRNSELAPQMDKGYKVEAWVDRILGGDSGKKYGVLIAIQRYKPARKG
jgi:hypothetical protein